MAEPLQVSPPEAVAYPLELCHKASGSSSPAAPPGTNAAGGLQHDCIITMSVWDSDYVPPLALGQESYRRRQPAHRVAPGGVALETGDNHST
jgi:hypothetical protein